MSKLIRPVLLGIGAFLAWLGVSLLLLLFGGHYLAPFSDSWIVTFPIIGALPAILLAGAVASHFGGTDWAPASAVTGFIGIAVLWLFAAFSGVWWVLIAVQVLGVALALGSGYVVQRFRPRA